MIRRQARIVILCDLMIIISILGVTFKSEFRPPEDHVPNVILVQCLTVRSQDWTTSAPLYSVADGRASRNSGYPIFTLIPLSTFESREIATYRCCLARCAVHRLSPCCPSAFLYKGARALPPIVPFLQLDLSTPRFARPAAR